VTLRIPALTENF